MATIGVTEAAKMVGLSRKTLYKHISKGKLSRAAGGLIDTSELLRVYGAFVSGVTPVTEKKVTQGDKVKALGDRTISMTADELEAIIKGAVKAALLEAMPLLLESKEAKPVEPLAIADDVELMRDGTPFKKLDFSDIPSL
ncbi:helix-turn-helix domain-containing protein [Paraglaciecola sp.]|nr:helix-turn-helix domain-containing protein [Paraglaciecola sp.]MDB4281828.1 helix-turn-helix domain-containing protein [Paraglaciecola sp.]